MEPAELYRLSKWYKGIAADYRRAAAVPRHRKNQSGAQLHQSADAAEAKARSFARRAQGRGVLQH